MKYSPEKKSSPLLIEYALVSLARLLPFRAHHFFFLHIGPVNGAAVGIEKELQRYLVWLSCRHHVLEVVLGEVFATLMGPSTGPGVPIFKNFQENTWPKIDKTTYDTFNSYPASRKHLASCADEIVSFCKEKIKVRPSQRQVI